MFIILDQCECRVRRKPDIRPNKKIYISHPRPLHFLAPPLFLFIIFCEQRFLTLRRCSYLSGCGKLNKQMIVLRFSFWWLGFPNWVPAALLPRWHRGCSCLCKMVLLFCELSLAFEYPSLGRDPMRHFRSRGLVELRYCMLFLSPIWVTHIGYAARHSYSSTFHH